jgi:hypothetical protein
MRDRGSSRWLGFIAGLLALGGPRRAAVTRDEMI